jgi:oleate hydratase
MVSGFNQLHGIMRTVYNQYDSLVRPLQKWLEDRGVRFQYSTEVRDLQFEDLTGQSRVVGIVCEGNNGHETIALALHDAVIATLGSMTESSSLGGMDSAAVLNGSKTNRSWAFWKKIALNRKEFGHPGVFSDHVNESKWLSFTTTLHDHAFFDLIRDLTSNAPGEGGLITFADSNWLMSIVLPHQPHFVDQPSDVQVFWGYGLFIDRPGDFVKKSMADCTGREIMIELLGHLRAANIDRVLDRAICIPCLMPFITNQFLRRERGDRPDVKPHGYVNLAFIGQFCEQPDDVVFTVEYSIRSAQAAVYRLLNMDLAPPPVYKGAFDMSVLYSAFEALHDL